MCGKIKITNCSFLSFLIILICSLSPQSLAEVFRHNDALFFYAEASIRQDNNFQNLELVPIRLMDNASLFLAAQAELDTVMSHSHKVMNNQWLASNQHNTYSGIRAIRKLFSRGARNLVRMSRAQAASQYTVLNKRPKMRKNFKTPEIFKIRNYDIAVSGNRVFLKFEQRFSLSGI